MIKIMKRFVYFIVMLIICTFYAPVPALCEDSAAGLEVYFLDLGRVDGILIRADGETCFIDVGFRDSAKGAIEFLRAMGIERLDSYVGTHAHADHVEGAAEIIENFHPEKLYMSHRGCRSAILECANKAQRELVSATEAVYLEPGDSFTVGRGQITCLGPLKILKCSVASNDENDNSLILRLDYGARSLLLTGDTSDHVLREVNNRFPGRLQTDVLKNPHHDGAHDEDVINLIKPQIVVFCTDDSNQPKGSYLRMLSRKGVRTLLTGSENQGNVAIVSDGESLEVRCGYTAWNVAINTPPPMYPGQQVTLTASVLPEDALKPKRQLGWNSSDESILKVHNGVVTAVSLGEATITATTINGASASVNVRVYSAVPLMEEQTMRLNVGETKRISGSVVPSGVAGLTGEWFSSDPSVATVVSGKVTGVGKGEAIITARLSNGAESICEVTVLGVQARSVRLNRDSATMKLGDTLTLSAKVKPAEYDLEDLDWSSSDDSILWVDQYGNVTAVGRGRAKITVTASEGVRDTCSIKVK